MDVDNGDELKLDVDNGDELKFNIDNGDELKFNIDNGDELKLDVEGIKDGDSGVKLNPSINDSIVFTKDTIFHDLETREIPFDQQDDEEEDAVNEELSFNIDKSDDKFEFNLETM